MVKINRQGKKVTTAEASACSGIGCNFVECKKRNHHLKGKCLGYWDTVESFGKPFRAWRCEYAQL